MTCSFNQILLSNKKKNELLTHRTTGENLNNIMWDKISQTKKEHIVNPSTQNSKPGKTNLQ